VSSARSAALVLHYLSIRELQPMAFGEDVSCRVDYLAPAMPLAFTSAEPNWTVRHIRWAPLNTVLSRGHEPQRIKESDSIDFMVSAGFNQPSGKWQ
jgi:hypothetical protein